MNTTIKEIMDKCEVCQNLDNHIWHGQRIIGTFLEWVKRDKTGTIISYRCDIHYSEDEVEEYPMEGYELND